MKEDIVTVGSTISFRSSGEKPGEIFRASAGLRKTVALSHPVSSVTSESPMISQLELELLMWVGLRPLPDRVRKPKLQWAD